MRELGICKQTGRVYEGSSSSGIPVEGRSYLFPIAFHELSVDAATHAGRVVFHLSLPSIQFSQHKP
jgi:hypothetical protein